MNAKKTSQLKAIIQRSETNEAIEQKISLLIEIKSLKELKQLEDLKSAAKVLISFGLLVFVANTSVLID